ncbi:rhomboid family intramembrane serine protease [Nakamurella aerolata]|uniref:Rhomboid family intramembrane serine protease n=1 Tax=Nakamurella aerolata TaxID=1656892 RepID=A0A849AA12_9ACTN|nr:rhomboid family intramembrane serine protease [Nakamurella aerolata]
MTTPPYPPGSPTPQGGNERQQSGYGGYAPSGGGWPSGYGAQDARGAQPLAGQQVCSWHPDRPTGLQCSRCGRPACPSCLTHGSVGQQCRQCVAEQQPAAARTISGSKLGEQPLVSYVLIGINVVVFIITALQVRRLSLSLSDGSAFFSSQLFDAGALIPINVGAGEYWRVWTSGFLHLGVAHIAMNMLSLFFIGPPLERVLGRWRFLAVYLLSLLGGSALAMVASAPVSVSAGASGAIFGILGGLAVAFKRMKANMQQILMVLVLNIIFSFSIAGISWQAHIGGLIVGAAATAAMVYGPPERRKQLQIGACVGLLVVCAAIIGVRGASLPDGKCVYQDGLSGTGLYCPRL